ncbi:MAG: sigma-70 family RNA polymerase sigma factor [Gemmatimonadota bacterium]
MSARAAGSALVPDRDLVDGILHSGDERAFRELYRRYTPRLLMTAMRLLGGSEMDAEDAVQETWIRAVRELAGFRWKSALPTWLTAIACNVARDQLRRIRRRAEQEPVRDDQPSSSPRTGETIDLERAITLLPEGYRTVLVLHDLEGLTHDEIGSALGIAPGTSKSQLSGARRSLRMLLNPVEEADDVIR